MIDSKTAGEMFARRELAFWIAGENRRVTNAIQAILGIENLASIGYPYRNDDAGFMLANLTTIPRRKELPGLGDK